MAFYYRWWIERSILWTNRCVLMAFIIICRSSCFYLNQTSIDQAQYATIRLNNIYQLSLYDLEKNHFNFFNNLITIGKVRYSVSDKWNFVIGLGQCDSSVREGLKYRWVSTVSCLSKVIFSCFWFSTSFTPLNYFKTAYILRYFMTSVSVFLSLSLVFILLPEN